MKVSHQVTLIGSVMQSFTSIGPMLDVAALFSAIAFYSGAFLGLVMVIAFLVTFTTIYVVYALSSRFQSNGGYYFFIGKILGKKAGISVSIMYVVYAILVIPNISLFVSFFTASYVHFSPMTMLLWRYLIPLLFLLSVTGIVSQGLGRSIKYTVAAGSLELFFLLALDFLFFSKTHTFSIPLFPNSSTQLMSALSGIVFGVLAFAGSGSSIFLSEDTVNGSKTVPRGLKYSYVGTGILLILSAFALVSFLGSHGIELYSLNPFYVGISIRKTLGTWVYLIFGIMAVISATNLSVAYGNALFNAIRKMVHHSILPSLGLSSGQMMLLFVVMEGIIIEVTSLFLGNITGFLMLAGIVSFSYMAVHIIAGMSLVKLSVLSRKIWRISAALASTIILSITFVFSVIADSSPGQPTRISELAFLLVITGTLLITTMGLSSFQRWYSRIDFAKS